MKKSTVRIFAMVLAALMVLSLLPLAYANAEETEIPVGTEIPGFIWVGDQLMEDGHRYGEVVNDDFLVDPSDPGDCVTPAVYWKSCINVNPYTGKTCGVTAQADWEQAMERLKTELAQRRANGEQADFESIFKNAITELDAKYKFTGEAKGHTWVEVEYQPSTCEQVGWENFHYCADCGEKSGYVELPPTGHRFVNGVCEICGIDDPNYVPPVETEEEETQNDASSEGAESADDVNEAEEVGEEIPGVNEENAEAAAPVEGGEDGQEAVEQTADEPGDEPEATDDELEEISGEQPRDEPEVTGGEQPRDEPEETGDEQPRDESEENGGEQPKDESEEISDEQPKDEPEQPGDEQPKDETSSETELPTREEIRENMQMTVGETDPAIVDKFKESMEDLGLDAERTTILNVMDVTPLHKDDNTKLSDEELEIVGGIDFVMPLPEGYDPNGAPLEVYHFNEKTGEWELMEIEVDLENNRVIVKNAKSFSPFAMIRKGAADPFVRNPKRLDKFVFTQGSSPAFNADPDAPAGPYTVTFDSNGGTLTGETTRQTDENGKLTLPAASECTKEGFALVAWKKGEESYAPGAEVTFTEDTTLTAQWDKTYTVTFYGAGGTRKEGEAEVSTAEQSILESEFTKAGDKGVALDSNPFTREGYVFTGWSKNNDGTKTIDENGTVTADEFTDAKLPLYACWAGKATVTFDPNYSTTIKPKTQEVPKDAETPLDKNTYKRSGYFFAGWYKNKECTGTALESIKTSEDVTLYAKWAGPVYMTGSITGDGSDAYVGETLTAEVDNAAGIKDFSYQWVYWGTGKKADGTTATGWVSISGETQKTYVPTANKDGKRVACRVTRDGVNALTNAKTVKGSLDDVKWKQDLIDIVDGEAATKYAQPGQIQGVTKDMEYSTNGTSWSKVTEVSDKGVMTILTPGIYKFRLPGTKLESDLIPMYRWFTLSYSTSIGTETSTGSGSKTTISGSGTAKMLSDGKAMPIQTTTTAANPNIKRYAGVTNMWLVREGADETITLTIRPSSGSYGHWRLNGGSYHNVGSETTVTVSPMEGPEHYVIIFNRSSASPRTADESRLGLWAALCVTSLTGAAMILTRTRKRRKNAME